MFIIPGSLLHVHDIVVFMGGLRGGPREPQPSTPHPFSELIFKNFL